MTRLVEAEEQDAESIVALRVAVAGELTARFGEGHWSVTGTIRSVEHALHRGGLYVIRDAGTVIATVILTTRKPWAIDPQYFTPTRRPLYLTSMAVDPARQRQGVGRACLAAVEVVARRWPAQFIRLDAYDAAAGAGPFYARCGYREVGRAEYRKTALIYFERAVNPHP